MAVPPEVAALVSAAAPFAGLPPAARAALCAGLRTVVVPAGGILFREGEAGDSLFVLLSGRLEVSVDGTVVRTQRRGDVLGELTLLTGRPRSATLRAVRDSELAVVDRSAFQELLVGHQEVLAGLVDVVVGRLPGAGATQVPDRRGVVALSGCEAVPGGVVDEVVRRLGAELAGLTSSTTFAEPSGDPSSWGAALDAAEADHDLVLLVASRPGTAWADFCRRQADRRLVVVPAAPPRGGCCPAPDDSELVVVGRGPGATTWLESHPGRRHLLGPEPAWPGLGRLARRLAGKALGVVLSGGGARGLAHVGVVQSLEAAGVVVDRWGGTSMGALVAASYARGTGTEELLGMLRRELVEANPFRDFRLPRHSLIRAGRAGAMLHRVLGDDRIEWLAAPFFCVSCDLYAAAEVVHRDGRLVEAVGASMRIPGVAPPLPWRGRLLVDGGVLNNLPIDVMAGDDEGPVVAVDVMRPFGPHAAPVLPTIVDTVGRAMVLGSWQKSVRTREQAALVVTPELGGVGMFDFSRLDDIVERGRRAGAAAWAQFRPAL